MSISQSRVNVFFADLAEWWCGPINQVTDGIWPHIGLIFEPLGQPKYMSEAVVGTGVTHNPMSKLRDEAAIVGGRVVVVPLDPDVFNYTEENFLLAFAFAQKCEGLETYSYLEIIELLGAETFDTPVTTGPGKTVCSTHVCRTLLAGGLFDTRDVRHNTNELTTPNSIWRRIADKMGGLDPWTVVGAAGMPPTDPLLAD